MRFSRKRPDFLDQPIVEFPQPFAGEEGLDRFAALQKFGAIAPAAVGCVCERHALRVPAIPRVLASAHLLRSGFQCERRQWRTRLIGIAPVGWQSGEMDNNAIA